MTRTAPESGPERRAQADHQVTMGVVRHIRGLIESGALRPGERLPPEREFARELGVSRASLRAGVGYLAAMGILQVRHGVGSFVSAADGPRALSSAAFEMTALLQGFTPRQLFEARLIVEGSIAALAAERCTEAHCAGLREEIAGMEATLGDAATYLIHDVRFHRLLGEAAGNPILLAMMETLGASVYDTRRPQVAHGVDPAGSLAAHRGIYEAVCARDGAGARGLMEQHLRDAERGMDAERG
jgi:GntR family transcriptional regulator, transcriptional repressor for pyruvate dehydrogenase complex